MEIFVDLRTSFARGAVLLYDQQENMAITRRTGPPPHVKQWMRELESLRSAIGHQHDRLIEDMRADETSLLEALYSFDRSRKATRRDTSAHTGKSGQ